MSSTYSSGEEIQSGDRILYRGEPGPVEFVSGRGDSQTGWYVERFGGGFVSKADEDLEFAARGAAAPMS
jgi:hypothetical protein